MQIIIYTTKTKDVLTESDNYKMELQGQFQLALEAI